MKRSEFIQRAVLADTHGSIGDDPIATAVALADALEKSGVAPWDDAPTEDYADVAARAAHEGTSFASESTLRGAPLRIDADRGAYAKGVEDERRDRAEKTVTVVGSEGRVVEREARLRVEPEQLRQSYAGMTPWLDAVIALKVALVARTRAWDRRDLAEYETRKVMVEEATRTLYRTLVP